MMNKRSLLLLTIALFLVAPEFSIADEVKSEPPTTRIFIIGDSTAAPGSGVQQMGWGVPFADYFNPRKVAVRNKARGGRSSRSFITEGLWGKALAEMQPGDLVLIQFGHNDDGAINREPSGSTRPLRARGSLPGLGEENVLIDNAVTGKPEVVHTYGYYMRKMIAESRDKGAVPILLSLTARNVWDRGHLERGSGNYGSWTYQLAMEAAVPFVDLTGLMVQQFEPLGKEALNALYPKDHTHTNAAGADAHARAIVSGLKGLRPNPVESWLSDKGEAVAADPNTWLNLPLPERKGLPTLFLIGDSTVRNGRGDGFNGEWGWGDYLDVHFDLEDINVVNRAVGGMSSRTFYWSPFWMTVRDWIRPGDFVIMQFGHNDDYVLNDKKRARGSIKGTGEETVEIDNMLTGKHEAVHTYGWYLRQYVAETRARGATPIICSPVPRKRWSDDGTLLRDENSYPHWAREVAVEENVPFIDLHERISDIYDQWGKEAVEPLFADPHTHTSKEGAVLNAACVVEVLWNLEANPLQPFLKATGRPETMKED